jgi:hypothetical protein
MRENNHKIVIAMAGDKLDMFFFAKMVMKITHQLSTILEKPKRERELNSLLRR